jgi:hypothetical protein
VSLAHTLVREPLVYFVLAGTLVFGVSAALGRDANTIRIPPQVKGEIARALQGRLGRAPGATDLEGELERWKEEQALYREAVKMGLRDDDPFVVSHIAAKLRNIARERDVFPEATDQDLREFLERNRSRFSVPATYDFEQVFLSQTHDDAPQRAQQIVAELRAGMPPEGLGDWFPRGTRFSSQTANDVAQLLGEQAATEIAGYAVHDWHLVQGPRGFHAIRVTAVDRGEPDFDKLRPALVIAYDAQRRDDAARSFARQVTGRYRFVDSE